MQLTSAVYSILQPSFNIGYGTSIGVAVDGEYLLGAQVTSSAARRGLIVSFVARLDQAQIDTSTAETAARAMTATTLIQNVQAAAASANVDAALVPASSAVSIAPPSIVVQVTDPPVVTHHVHLHLTLLGYSKGTFPPAAFTKGVAEHLQVWRNRVAVDNSMNTIMRRWEAVEVRAHVDATSETDATSIASDLRAVQQNSSALEATLQQNGLLKLQGVLIHTVATTRASTNEAESDTVLHIIIGVLVGTALLFLLGVAYFVLARRNRIHPYKLDPRLERCVEQLGSQIPGESDDAYKFLLHEKEESLKVVACAIRKMADSTHDPRTRERCNKLLDIAGSAGSDSESGIPALTSKTEMEKYTLDSTACAGNKLYFDSAAGVPALKTQEWIPQERSPSPSMSPGYETCTSPPTSPNCSTTAAGLANIYLPNSQQQATPPPPLGISKEEAGAVPAVMLDPGIMMQPDESDSPSLPNMGWL